MIRDCPVMDTSTTFRGATQYQGAEGSRNAQRCSKEGEAKEVKAEDEGRREKRNKTSGRYFIDKFIQKPNCVNIIPDIRYCEYANDELYWLKKEVNGILIFVDRKNIQDANEYEKNNNSYIKKQSNHVLNWDTLDEKNPNDLIVIDNFAKTIIDDIYLPFTNRTI